MSGSNGTNGCARPITRAPAESPPAGSPRRDELGFGCGGLLPGGGGPLPSRPAPQGPVPGGRLPLQQSNAGWRGPAI
ncbi:MAG: hypothetical protein BRD35_00935 [Bacteroidetes bacterium QH_7_62_13]|nr:MAG: hypothetical protein BRD35_00935 [Bacteroidetes bacterium QH_7_62_13]